ncbi:MAG: hypothetical protein ACREGH_01655 [Minisyncoccia bacterium]
MLSGSVTSASIDPGAGASTNDSASAEGSGFDFGGFKLLKPG